jgi:hypothetical protein
MSCSTQNKNEVESLNNGRSRMLCDALGYKCLVFCSESCTAQVPWVIWQLLVNVVVTPLYFCLRMLQYQYQAEREAWVCYIRTVEERVYQTFGANISGDLSLLHQPIAAALRIYNAAFEETKCKEPKHIRQLLAIKEEGLRDATTAEIEAVQQNAAAESLETFMQFADLAQTKMKELIEPLISQQRFKSIQWNTSTTRECPTCLPSALFAMDPGVKSADAVMATAHHLHGGRLNRSTNAARLKLVFANCSTLMQGLAALQDMFEVVGLINGFANPTPMGMRALYLVVKVRLVLAVDDASEDEGSPPTAFFLAQLQLQLLQYEQAQEEAAPQDQLFIERLPAVCHQLDPKDQPYVQEMIAELMKTFRPTSSTALPFSRSRWHYFWHFLRCHRRGHQALIDSSNIKQGFEGSTINSGRETFGSERNRREAFTSVVRMPVEAGGVSASAPSTEVRRVVSCESNIENLEEPLLNGAAVVEDDVEPCSNLRGAYRTVEKPLDDSIENETLSDNNGAQQLVMPNQEVLVEEGTQSISMEEGEERQRRQSTDVYQQHSAAADTMWYDIRWALEFEQNKQFLSQDLLVLIKTLAASIALFFVTREGQLIRCVAVSYTAYERHDCCWGTTCQQVLTHARVTNATLHYEQVLHTCDPHLDLSFLDNAFTALIAANVTTFAALIGLRYAANCRWKAVYEFQWLKDHSLHVSVGFFVMAAFLAILKVLVATSYSGMLLHAPRIQFDGADDGRHAYVRLPSSVTNCTHVSTETNGITTEHHTRHGECVVAVDCARQCTLQMPKALQTLCSMYLLAAFYIAYLGYEFHRALCIDRNTFSLGGCLARIAQWLTPLLRFLPDVAAWMKYGLVALTIGVTLTQQEVVRCRNLQDDQLNVTLEVSGADMNDGCNPSVEPLLGSRRGAIMALFGIEGALIAIIITIKQRTLWPSHAGRIVGAFVVSQVVILGLQLFFIGELASLKSMHGLPDFGCVDSTIYSTAHDASPSSALHRFRDLGSPAWQATNLSACPTPPTPPPTVNPKPTPKPTPHVTPKPTPPSTLNPTVSPTSTPAGLPKDWTCQGYGAQTKLNVTVTTVVQHLGGIFGCYTVATGDSCVGIAEKFGVLDSDIKGGPQFAFEECNKIRGDGSLRKVDQLTIRNCRRSCKWPVLIDGPCPACFDYYVESGDTCQQLEVQSVNSTTLASTTIDMWRAATTAMPYS